MKTLCKLTKKNMRKDGQLIYELVHKAEFICVKCLRSSANKKSLCKAIPLDELIS